MGKRRDGNRRRKNKETKERQKGKEKDREKEVVGHWERVSQKERKKQSKRALAILMRGPMTGVFIDPPLTLVYHARLAERFDE